MSTGQESYWHETNACLEPLTQTIMKLWRFLYKKSKKNKIIDMGNISELTIG